jgi:hypothetical protein
MRLVAQRADSPGAHFVNELWTTDQDAWNLISSPDAFNPFAVAQHGHRFEDPYLRRSVDDPLPGPGHNPRDHHFNTTSFVRRKRPAMFNQDVFNDNADALRELLNMPSPELRNVLIGEVADADVLLAPLVDADILMFPQGLIEGIMPHPLAAILELVRYIRVEAERFVLFSRPEFDVGTGDDWNYNLSEMPPHDFHVTSTPRRPIAYNPTGNPIRTVFSFTKLDCRSMNLLSQFINCIQCLLMLTESRPTRQELKDVIYYLGPDVSSHFPATQWRDKSDTVSIQMTNFFPLTGKYLYCFQEGEYEIYSENGLLKIACSPAGTSRVKYHHGVPHVLLREQFALGFMQIGWTSFPISRLKQNVTFATGFDVQVTAPLEAPLGTAVIS